MGDWESVQMHVIRQLEELVNASNGTNATGAVACLVNCTSNSTATGGNSSAAGDSTAAAEEGAELEPVDPTLDDGGWEVLSYMTYIVCFIFVFGVVCVLRGTGTLSRPMRKICMVTDG